MTAISKGPKRFAILGGVVIMLLTIWLQVTDLPWLKHVRQRMEYMGYDVMLQNTVGMLELKNSPVVIVAIDEASVNALGRWPWSRDKIVELLTRLNDANVSTIAFDIVFSEPEKNVARDVLNELHMHKIQNDLVTQTLRDLVPALDHDQQLAQAIKGSPVVTGFIFHSEYATKSGVLPAATYRFNGGELQSSVMIAAKGYTANLSLLQQNAKGGGFLSVLRDHDGVLRRVPLVMRYQNSIYTSLSLAAAQHYLLIDKIDFMTSRVGGTTVLDNVRLGSILLPTDAVGQVLVPFIGGPGTIPHYSAVDVLEGKVGKEKLTGALVFIGPTALGIADITATPVSPVYPGVEVHATVAATILDGQFPYVPAWAEGASLVLLLLVGGVLAIVLPSLGALGILGMALFVLASFLSMTAWLWVSGGVVLPAVVPNLQVVWLSAFNLTNGFIREARQRHHLRHMFERYVPPQHIDEMGKDPEKFGVAGSTREMTVLFSDIRDFTTLSEKLSATELKDLLNRFFTPMTQIIFDCQGTIDKYVGDMVMAFWGAPLDDSSHAHHALQAALAMQAKAPQLREEFAQLGLPEIVIGVGLNSGPMAVGDMGSEFRLSYTVLGDSVNLGSRLEGLSKFYRAGIVASETTCARQDDFVFRQLDKVQVKGKEQAIHIYQPLGYRKDASANLLAELTEHETALAAYWSRKWGSAIEKFSALHRAHPDVYVYELFLHRSKELAKHPPGKEWSGVYVRLEK